MRFIQKIFHLIASIIRGYFIAVGILVTLFFVLIFVVISKYSSFHEAGLSGTTLGAHERLMVRVNIDEGLTDESSTDSRMLWKRLFSDKEPLTLADLSTMLRRAKEDKRVKGIFFNVENMRGSLAVIGEARAAIEAFKTSGKKVVFYLNSLNSSDLYLASLGDQVILAPLGDVMLTGEDFQLVYAKSLLEKIGVSFNVIRAGKYKSAMEPLIADEPSPATYEMYQTLEESIRSELTTKIAAGRKRPKADVDAWFKHSLYTALEARDLKIVDALGYEADIEEKTKKEWDAETIVSPSDYVAATSTMDAPLLEANHGKIALIEAMGTIYTQDPSGSGASEVITQAKFIEELQWATENKDVKAVVLRISSPGGSALASDNIHNAIKKLKAAKPLIVSIGSVAASGGYYIAAPANMIIAQPASITGSIGVTSMLPNLAEFKKKYGISFYLISGSDRAGALNIGDKLSENDRMILGEGVDYVYQTFMAKVADGRHMTIERVRALAEGRVYTGAQALGLGLVDKLGTLSDAFREAKQLAKLDPNRLYPIERYEGKEMSPLQCFSSTSNFISCMKEGKIELKVRLSGLSSLEDIFRKKAEVLTNLLADDKILAYWPHELMSADQGQRR